MFGWLLFLRSGDKPGFGSAAELLFSAKPKKSNPKKRATSVPLTRFLALLAAFRVGVPTPTQTHCRVVCTPF